MIYSIYVLFRIFFLICTKEIFLLTCAWFLEGLEINYDLCGKPNRLTIVQRHQRRILNLEELMSSAKNAGIDNVQTVTFEELTLREQMKAAYCTDVLVGIQGTIYSQNMSKQIGNM